MRTLLPSEMLAVAGGEYTFPTFPIFEYDGKNNNGYGNGAEFGPPPGRSGEHNPQLLDSNRGPKGDR